MTTKEERPNDEEASQSNHIDYRLRVRKETKQTVGALDPLYDDRFSDGVPETEIFAFVRGEVGATKRHIRDALDHLERSGELYQVNGCWKVTRP